MRACLHKSLDMCMSRFLSVPLPSLCQCLSVCTSRCLFPAFSLTAHYQGIASADADSWAGLTPPSFSLLTTLLPGRRHAPVVSPRPRTTTLDSASVSAGTNEYTEERLSLIALATAALVEVVTSETKPATKDVLAVTTVLAQLHTLALPTPWDRASGSGDDVDAMTAIRLGVFDGLRRVASTPAVVAVVPEVVDVWRRVEVVEPTTSPAILPMSTVDLVRRFNILKAATRCDASVPPLADQAATGRERDVATAADVDRDSGCTGTVVSQSPLDPTAAGPNKFGLAVHKVRNSPVCGTYRCVILAGVSP